MSVILLLAHIQVSLDAATGYAYGQELLESSLFYEPQRATAAFFHATDSRKSGPVPKCFHYYDAIVVKSGKVRVEKHSGGKKVVLAELGPGKAVGEMSLIDSSPTSACVIAVEALDLLALGRLDLDVLLNWNPILAAKMWHSFTQMLSERLRDMNEKMLERYGEEILREP